MYEPLVSIVIPVYNGSNYMREAIDSALAQTYKNIEVIVINDGSCDSGETDKIARSYGDKIRYYSKENGGVSSALNKGIQEMSGEYFSWLSHDDVYEDDKIEKQILALNGVDKNTLICCNYMQINELSKPISGYKPTTLFEYSRVYDSKEALSGILKKATLNGCCLLIPREALLKSGMFDESLRFCQDAFMWYKIFLNGYSLFCIDNVSVKNRIHAKQLTQTGQNLFRKECGVISEVLMNLFAEASIENYNFLKMYLLSDAKYLDREKIKGIITVGKERHLITMTTAIKAYCLLAYGKVRPYIRNIYYKLFRNMIFN